MAVAGLQEVVLWTHGMEEMLGFYQGVFGLEVFSPPEMAAKFLRAGDEIAGVPQVVVLVPHPHPSHRFPAEKPERTLHHLAFVVDPAGYDEQLETCRQAGLEVREGKHPIFKDSRTFYVDDPEGNEVEVITRP